jgi:hypothetical protein
MEIADEFVQALANCRNFGADSDTDSLSFQPLTIGTSIAFYPAPEAMSTRTNDAEDHEERKR